MARSRRPAHRQRHAPAQRPPIWRRSDYDPAASLWTLADDYRAIVQADGRRIVVVAANYSHDSQNTVDLRASQDGRSMTGTYVVRKIETGEVRDRGTLSLRKDGGQFPVWLGVCNAPGWAIVVREER